jgi:hypothetical protein
MSLQLSLHEKDYMGKQLHEREAQIQRLIAGRRVAAPEGASGASRPMSMAFSFSESSADLLSVSPPKDGFDLATSMGAGLGGGSGFLSVSSKRDGPSTSLGILDEEDPSESREALKFRVMELEAEARTLEENLAASEAFGLEKTEEVKALQELLARETAKRQELEASRGAAPSSQAASGTGDSQDGAKVKAYEEEIALLKGKLNESEILIQQEHAGAQAFQQLLGQEKKARELAEKMAIDEKRKREEIMAEITVLKAELMIAKSMH